MLVLYRVHKVHDFYTLCPTYILFCESTLDSNLA